MSRAVIFANGILPEPTAFRSLLRPDDFVIAADGGLRNAYAAGVAPHVLIGDFDSLSQVEVSSLAGASVEILCHPVEKDETDLELAIAHAVEKQFKEIVVAGALGGRLDQTLGNIALLSDVPPGVSIRLDDGHDEVFLIREHVQILGSPGDTVSLIPWGLAAEGVKTNGLRYPLRGELLHPEKSRGISNELKGKEASIDLTQGMLIVVHTRKKESV
jgi:thiamine pyrophosphokinase